MRFHVSEVKEFLLGFDFVFYRFDLLFNFSRSKSESVNLGVLVDVWCCIVRCLERFEL